jgi:hypothetical protein
MARLMQLVIWNRRTMDMVGLSREEAAVDPSVATVLFGALSEGVTCVDQWFPPCDVRIAATRLGTLDQTN